MFDGQNHVICTHSVHATVFTNMTMILVYSIQVQIKPWRIADSCHTSGSSQSIDCRKAVFVGGVPRPLRACELAEVMTDKFGPVSFVAIDCDVDLKYPKGIVQHLSCGSTSHYFVIMCIMLA